VEEADSHAEASVFGKWSNGSHLFDVETMSDGVLFDFASARVYVITNQTIPFDPTRPSCAGRSKWSVIDSLRGGMVVCPPRCDKKDYVCTSTTSFCFNGVEQTCGSGATCQAPAIDNPCRPPVGPPDCVVYKDAGSDDLWPDVPDVQPFTGICLEEPSSSRNPMGWFTNGSALVFVEDGAIDFLERTEKTIPFDPAQERYCKGAAIDSRWVIAYLKGEVAVCPPACPLQNYECVTKTTFCLNGVEQVCGSGKVCEASAGGNLCM
jgi:hypothetical protein